MANTPPSTVDVYKAFYNELSNKVRQDDFVTKIWPYLVSVLDRNRGAHVITPVLLGTGEHLKSHLANSPAAHDCIGKYGCILVDCMDIPKTSPKANALLSSGSSDLLGPGGKLQSLRPGISSTTPVGDLPPVRDLVEAAKAMDIVTTMLAMHKVGPQRPPPHMGMHLGVTDPNLQ